ncbi:MAG: MarR family transcriptional regulator [Chlorobi bacterium]|nr:MarR family transcriptional regulator [Chlorobiota bacterium]
MNIKETIDFQLKSTSLALMRMYNLIASQNGITQSLGYVLVNIGKNGTPATKIAPLMGMGITSLSRLLNKMEKEGYVYRTRDKKDKRVVIISLTDKGISLRKQVKKTVVDFNNKIINKIPASEMKIFMSVFNTIKEQVETDIVNFNLKNSIQ